MNKRLMLAKALCATGINYGVSKLRRNQLIVLNYHRIAGADHSTEFDNDVYEHTVEVFRRQVQWLSNHFEMLDESRFIEVATSGGFELKHNAALITFDDGYADNYELAYPVLKSLGVPAIFYVPCNLIESREVGWWDKISWVVGKTTQQSGEIRGIALDFRSPAARSHTAKQLHSYLKLNPYTDTHNLVEELSEMLGVPLPGKDIQAEQLMSWDQLRDAAANGIAIGSHSMSHRLLSQISVEEQVWELTESRRVIESRIGRKVRTVAYPVGQRTSFNEDTKRIAREAGYELGFSFYPGCYWGKVDDLFDVRRVALSPEDALFKNEVIFPKLFYRM